MARLRVYSPVFKKEVAISALQDRGRITDLSRLHPPPNPWGSMASVELGKRRPNSEPYYRWVGGRYHGHAGIDVDEPKGTKIYAPYDGKIWINEQRNAAGEYDGQGLYILLRMFARDGSETAITFAHLSKVHVKPGQMVKRGDLLGEVGSTGFATGPHLHFAVFRTDAKTKAKDCLEAYGFLVGEVDQDGRALKRRDPAGSRRNADGRLELADTDPYDTAVTDNPIQYQVRAERGINVRRLPGVNFEVAEDIKYLPKGAVVLIDKWCNYDDLDEHGEPVQSWGRIAGMPYHWVAIRYDRWLMGSVVE